MIRPQSLSTLLLAVALSPLAIAQGTKVYEGQGPITEGGCNLGNTTSLCIPVDATHTVVTFDGNLGGSGPANPGDPCQRNDDDTTLAVNLPFSFDLFGSPQNQVFINNNGNLSFGAGFSTFTSTGFPVNSFPMIAPFWADVDTRNTASGVVYYKVESNRLTVTWDHVGYYSAAADKRSTFQVIISDGTDPFVGLGQNVCFCYGDMQWTTGDASGGTSGFGGTPATVGINAGDGVNFFQLGRFDQPGTAYDGPGGASDGVDFLDNTRQCFATGTVQNTPPIFINSPSGCLMASVGVPVVFSVQAIGPEANQIVNIVETTNTPNVTCVPTPGNPASITCTFTPAANQAGITNLVFVATDNFTPPASSTLTVCLNAAECHQLVGRGGTGSSVTLFGHTYATHLTSVRQSWPVTMTDRPSLRVPNLTTGQLNFSMQTVMFNPQVFPSNPSQWSQRLRLTVLPGLVVQGELLDSLNGIHQSLATYVDSNGHLYMTFPFTIDGL
ncbi:MAG: hypothetical protein NTY35_17380 [Planctomycetota bacterium]|nr:hypothetical protein [Planctomycetota bacterium]